MIFRPFPLPAFLRVSLALFGVLLLPGCALHPLGPLDKAPRHQSEELKGYAPFAWGISTSSLQYEDKAVEPGEKNYYVRDWDLLVKQGRHPSSAMPSILGATSTRISPP